jgi:hypothetical protein
VPVKKIEWKSAADSQCLCHHKTSRSCGGIKKEKRNVFAKNKKQKERPKKEKSSRRRSLLRDPVEVFFFSLLYFFKFPPPLFLKKFI